MRRIPAPAKINLALVVGPLLADGKHEVATVLQPVHLSDRIAMSAGERLTVSGFAGDTIVARALATLAAAAGVEPNWNVEITKAIPLAAGLGGGSSDAASALRLANDLLPVPLEGHRLEELAATVGADVPFFLRSGPQLGTGDGSLLAPVDLPQDFSVVLVLPDDEVKTSTRDVYSAFDARGGAAGFDERRAELLDALAAVSRASDLARLPPNDLAASPLSERLRETGAFRADVSGAGPCVYGLFVHRPQADAAARSLRPAGRTWVTHAFSSDHGFPT
jgi:4-diphosphocytidyl-2-C-methyl-D-erythritol kinase